MKYDKKLVKKLVKQLNMQVDESNEEDNLNYPHITEEKLVEVALSIGLDDIERGDIQVYYDDDANDWFTD